MDAVTRGAVFVRFAHFTAGVFVFFLLISRDTLHVKNSKLFDFFSVESVYPHLAAFISAYTQCGHPGDGWGTRPKTLTCPGRRAGWRAGCQILLVPQSRSPGGRR